MEVKTCKLCKRLFYTATGKEVCPRCKGRLEVKLQEVTEYLRINRKADIDTLAKECAVDVSQIQFWIREKRLILPPDSPIRIPCEKCGAMIFSGSLCEKCVKDKISVLNDLARAFR